MGLLSIYRTDTWAVLASEVRSSDPTASWVSGAFTGYKTWNCANKMMPQNLVIGGKTLTCANKVMPYNVMAYYRHIWAKYNSVLSYADTATYFGDAQPSDYKNYETGSYSSLYSSCNRSSYMFDTTTGKFSGMGSATTQTTSSGGYPTTLANNGGTYYGSYPGSYGATTFDKIFQSTNQVKWQCTGSAIRIYNGNAYSPYGAYVHTATGSYSKGSESYGNVEDTNENAHPTNGRDPYDGYWYVKIY